MNVVNVSPPERDGSALCVLTPSDFQAGYAVADPVTDTVKEPKQEMPHCEARKGTQ